MSLRKGEIEMEYMLEIQAGRCQPIPDARPELVLPERFVYFWESKKWRINKTGATNQLILCIISGPGDINLIIFTPRHDFAIIWEYSPGTDFFTIGLRKLEIEEIFL